MGEKWTFGTVVLRSCLGCAQQALYLSWSPDCASNSSFFPVCILGGSRYSVKFLDSCLSWGRPRLSCCLPAMAYPSPSYWRNLGSETTEGRFLSFRICESKQFVSEIEAKRAPIFWFTPQVAGARPRLKLRSRNLIQSLCEWWKSSYWSQKPVTDLVALTWNLGILNAKPVTDGWLVRFIVCM